MTKPGTFACPSIAFQARIAAVAAVAFMLFPVSSNAEEPLPFPHWTNTEVVATQSGNTIALELSNSVLEAGTLTLPRVNAPIKRLGWSGNGDAALKIVPEPDVWVFSWKKTPASESVIIVEFDRDPRSDNASMIATSAGDGSVMLHACHARTYGEKLRFEPQWYKNTVGYWTVGDDYVTWTFDIDQAGTFSVAILQGCGRGQGGSDAELTVFQGVEKTGVEKPGAEKREAEKVDSLSFQTIDTGHFQNFRWNDLGQVTISEPGRYTLRIEPKRIAKAALCDIRMVHLVRQAK